MLLHTPSPPPPSPCQAGCSVLVFCASKDQTERMARHIASMLPSIPDRSQAARAGGAAGREGAGAGAGGGEEEPPLDRPALLERLRAAGGGRPDGVLLEVLAQGVGYHNASLSMEERELVEQAYLRGEGGQGGAGAEGCRGSALRCCTLCQCIAIS